MTDLPPLAAAPFSGKGLAPYLDRASEDRVDACRMVANLFFETRNARLELAAAGHVLEPLLALLPVEPAAAEPLATMGQVLWKGHAHAEALRCLDAILDHPTDTNLGRFFRGPGAAPWHGQSPEPMTWPRERALLSIYRAECILAAGDSARGEAALEGALELARAVGIPPWFRLSAAIDEWGSASDLALRGLTLAARALRLRSVGEDIAVFRKVPKKRKADPAGDAKARATARAYLERALAEIAPRVAKQYAGLVPWDYVNDPKGLTAPTLSDEQQKRLWQARTFLELGLLDELEGRLEEAKRNVGRARFLCALRDPTLSRDADVRDVAERLGATNAPL